MVMRGSEGDEDEVAELALAELVWDAGDELIVSCDEELSRKAKSRSTSSIDRYVSCRFWWR
jgi:hypothetical protein